MSQNKLNRKLAALEASLASLRPKPSAIDRDRLIYRAGQAAAGNRERSARRSSAAGPWHWQLATALSLLVAVIFGGMLLSRNGPRVVERVVYVEKSIASPLPEPTPAVNGADAGDTAMATAVGERPRRKKLRTDYLQLRRLVLAEGVEALPKWKAGSPSAAAVPKWNPDSRNELKQLLGG